MGLLKKKKKPKYVEDILEYSGEVQRPAVDDRKRKPKKAVKSASPAKPASPANPAKEYCEQILTAAQGMEETKREYKIVTDYLKDIQKIEGLPEEETVKIQELAHNVVKLNESRNKYLNKSKTISDSQFTQMQQLEDEMPGIIKRLKENESYQATVKRDMQYLEGEKEEWRFYQETLEKEIKVLRRLLFLLAGVFSVTVLAILVLEFVVEFDLKTPFLAATLAAGAIGAIIAGKLQNDRVEVKKSQLNINRAVMLMNKVKFKYVNITNAVDYACERYHVKNSYELNYIWEQYIEAVKEHEKYERTNDELELANGRLIRQLQTYHLYDSKIWIYQANALVDSREMVEVNHELLIRRQKLRAGIEAQVANIREAKVEIAKLLKARPGNDQDIKGILDEVDKICGLA